MQKSTRRSFTGGAGKLLGPDGEPLNPPARSNSLLGTEYFREQIKRNYEQKLRFDALTRVMELRSSCGVEPELRHVTVRIPHQYARQD